MRFPPVDKAAPFASGGLLVPGRLDVVDGRGGLANHHGKQVGRISD